MNAGARHVGVARRRATSRDDGASARARRSRRPRRDRAALARRHDLPRVEREAAEQAERAARPPVARGSERAGGVLEDRQLGVALERRRAAEEVDGEDRLRPRRHARMRVVGIHVHRHRVDVDEHGRRTCERDDVAGRRERVGGHEHLVAGTEAEREHRHVQGRGARRDRDGVRRPDGVREQLLELGDLRAHRQLPGLEHVADLGELGLADVGRAEPITSGPACGRDTTRSSSRGRRRARPGRRSRCPRAPSRRSGCAARRRRTRAARRRSRRDSR